MRRPMNHLPTLLSIVVALTGIIGCSSLPKDIHRPPSSAIDDGNTTTLGRSFAGEVAAHPNQSGVFLLGNGLDAFVGRALLASLAERSIDVQYYMFHQDTVGRLLIDQLIKAADRGVRVRMLIDDIYGSEADDVWTAIDAHPKMEVRLFNPFVRDASKNLQWITRFRDVNYRMHSKSFTVDNQVTIVGGRNIGDEYFDANPDLAFADLDMLAIGPVVPEVSEAFDQYWNSDWAFPASALTQPATPEQLSDLRVRMDQFLRSEASAAYIQALKQSDLANALHAKTMVLDRKAMFVGSMNLDQRSPDINNEIGILFLNPEIAGQSAEAFDRHIEKVAFRLELFTGSNGSESLRWHLKKDDGEVVYDTEPYVGFWKKVGVGLIRLLPVESLL